MSIIQELRSILQENAQSFEQALDQFMRGAQQKIDADWKTHGYNVRTKPTLKKSKGKKFIRIFQENPSTKDRSAWAFINTENGDVLKPAGWKKPAKHARGNIYNDDYGIGTVTAYGPQYLR